MKMLVALILIQIVSRVICIPSYVIESYSKVRLQQPTMGLSVESHMPMDIILNPVLADEPPAQVDKMEGIFAKNEEMKNIKTMNIDEETIMKSINTQNLPQNSNDDIKDKNTFDESYGIVLGHEKPVGFTLASNSTSTDANSTQN
ncbi:CLUMA_CG018926, isoform A [Clunio marinus]|uniref:CLUMA_CG018926, isoform A n=1 Tax=Clunio marinus TaxID=568069 RepID=A0A1J1J0E5_9DIPT|nr:CLUMA_CG018926, isoform A [Clunio marinus]